MENEPRWLTWVRRLEAVAQTGLHFGQNPFDQERYAEIRSIAAEMASTGICETPQKITQLMSSGVGYATPKVDVRGVVIRDDQILLVRERADGKWTVPGGWADVNESPGVGAAREVFEESGYEVRTARLLACYDKLKHGHPKELHHTYKLFFLCELIGGTATPSDETEEVGFFSLEALPELSLPRITKEQIARMFFLNQHPELPADFD